MAQRVCLAWQIVKSIAWVCFITLTAKKLAEFKNIFAIWACRRKNHHNAYLCSMRSTGLTTHWCFRWDRADRRCICPTEPTDWIRWRTRPVRCWSRCSGSSSCSWPPRCTWTGIRSWHSPQDRRRWSSLKKCISESKKRGSSWGVVYKDPTANQAYIMDSLPCRTHPLQGHVEVLTSPSPSLGWFFCVLPKK